MREKQYKKRKIVVNIPTIVSAAISGATGGAVLGSVVASIPGAIIGSVLGTAITGTTAYSTNKNTIKAKKGNGNCNNNR